MIDEYEYVEYINPLFPNRQMYKCAVGSDEFHSDDFGKVVEWVYEAIAKLKCKEYKLIQDKAVTSFFEGSDTPKD